MKEFPLVEGTTWSAKVVLLSENEESFISLHVGDCGTYGSMTSEKKLATLKLVWKLCSDSLPKKPIPQVTVK